MGRAGFFVADPLGWKGLLPAFAHNAQKKCIKSRRMTKADAAGHLIYLFVYIAVFLFL